MENITNVNEIRKEYFKGWRNKNREKYNEYQRRYRAAHKDKVKKYNVKYWAKKAQELEGGSPIENVD